MKIYIENLDRQNNEDILREYFKNNNEFAVDMQEIINALQEQEGITIARSTLHNILLILMSEKNVGRKKIGNKYFYYKVNK